MEVSKNAIFGFFTDLMPHISPFLLFSPFLHFFESTLQTAQIGGPDPQKRGHFGVFWHFFGYFGITGLVPTTSWRSFVRAHGVAITC